VKTGEEGDGNFFSGGAKKMETAFNNAERSWAQAERRRVKLRGEVFGVQHTQEL